MPTPCRAAAAAFASRVTESDLPALRRLSASQRRAFALDLCALLDFATPGGERVSGSPSPNAGGLRAAVMIDHVPGMTCLLYTSPSPRDRQKSRMPSSA